MNGGAGVQAAGVIAIGVSDHPHEQNRGLWGACRLILQVSFNSSPYQCELSINRVHDRYTLSILHLFPCISPLCRLLLYSCLRICFRIPCRTSVRRVYLAMGCRAFPWKVTPCKIMAWEVAPWKIMAFCGKAASLFEWGPAMC